MSLVNPLTGLDSSYFSISLTNAGQFYWLVVMYRVYSIECHPRLIKCIRGVSG